MQTWFSYPFCASYTPESVNAFGWKQALAAETSVSLASEHTGTERQRPDIMGKTVF